jgi:hypothetical protein
MSYAVRIDGQGWRAVSSEADLLAGEVFAANLDGFTPAALTKAQQVAAYYAAKGKDPLLVQTVIDVIEDKAKTLAPTYGLTFDQAKAQFYATNKSYRECRIIKQGQIDIEAAP